MRDINAGTILKLLLASLCVGFFLSVLDISPQSLLQDIFGLAQSAFDNLIDFAGSAVSYVLLGAVIVVPIWLIMYISGKARG